MNTIKRPGITLLCTIIGWATLGVSCSYAQSVKPLSPAVVNVQSAEPSPAQSNEATGKFVNIYGNRIFYREAGKGPTVILLHGLGADASVWAFNIDALATKYHVIALDQIGFGKSDKPQISYRVETHVAYLRHFMRALKISHATLVGSSLGGWTAASFAIAHPEKVDKLVLVDASGFATDRKQVKATALSELNPTTREGVRHLLSKLFYNQRDFANEAVVEQVYQSKLAAHDGYSMRSFSASIARNEDVLDRRLAAVQKPTLIIWGQDDQVVPLSFGERFKKEIINSKLVVIPRCGHLPALEQSGLFNLLLLKFLGNNP